MDLDIYIEKHVRGLQTTISKINNLTIILDRYNIIIIMYLYHPSTNNYTIIYAPYTDIPYATPVNQFFIKKFPLI